MNEEKDIVTKIVHILIEEFNQNIDIYSTNLGKNTQEQIHYQIIHHAKNLLSGQLNGVSNKMKY